MNILLILGTLIGLCSTLFCLVTLIYHVSLHGNPADYYSPYRTLTEDELRGLKRQFPKETFQPEVYLIDNEPLMCQNISSYGRAVGGYSYHKLGKLKVDIFYLGIQKIISDYWQYKTPNSYYTCYIISAIGCAAFALWIYMSKIQDHPYALAEHTTAILSFYILALYTTWAISYSLYVFIKNKMNHKRLSSN